MELIVNNSWYYEKQRFARQSTFLANFVEPVFSKLKTENGNAVG